MSAGADHGQTLPGVLGRVAEVAGIGAALRLAAEFGGREIYLPDRLRPDHPLVKAIGADAAEAVVGAFGRGRLEVPLGPTSDHRRRGAEIRRLLGEGLSPSHIAGRLHCHVKTVRRHRKRIRRDPDQLDLLDDSGASG